MRFDYFRCISIRNLNTGSKGLKCTNAVCSLLDLDKQLLANRARFIYESFWNQSFKKNEGKNTSVTSHSRGGLFCISRKIAISKNSRWSLFSILGQSHTPWVRGSSRNPVREGLTTNMKKTGILRKYVGYYGNLDIWKLRRKTI